MNERNGGDVVVETLTALGARFAVGIPGQHALGLFDALRRSELELLSARVENNAGFMADGAARIVNAPVPLLLSTGPGALTALAALQESAASSVPVLAIAAQVPTAGLGGGRHGYLHELTDQSNAFRDIVKSAMTVRTLAQIPSAIAAAWRTALEAPHGPVLVEIPQDVLLADADEHLPPVLDLDAQPAELAPRAELVEEAARLLGRATRPVILAGGGVVRSRAQAELTDLAERLGAPVVTTFGGKGAIRSDHPLAAGSWIEDIATTEFLADADVLLVVGSGLGELSSNYHTFNPKGQVVQVEADLGKLGTNHDVLGVHADARLALAAIRDALLEATAADVSDPRPDIARLLDTVARRLDAQGLTAERDLLDGLRQAVPDNVDTFWDMTILGYWAWSAWDPRNGAFSSAQGAGGLGFAFPAALGAAFASRAAGRPGPVFAVSGDGGAMYGIAELASAVQHGLDVTWLIVDDGGYGILRKYMERRFGMSTATELSRPDFVALARSFGISTAVSTDIAGAPAAVAAALADPGPSVVVLTAKLKLFAPTHPVDSEEAYPMLGGGPHRPDFLRSTVRPAKKVS